MFSEQQWQEDFLNTIVNSKAHKEKENAKQSKQWQELLPTLQDK
jgi:hypothetical protein